MISGVIDASDRADAVARLKHRGMFLLSLEPVDARGSGVHGSGRLRVSRDEIAAFTRQLATLLKAGIPLVTALRTLQQQEERSSLATVLDGVAADVSESASLFEAMARYPRLFPRTYTAAIHAGEEGGMLQEVLARLALALKGEAEIRARIRGAMIYPIFLCVVGGLALAVLLTFVIPRLPSASAPGASNSRW